MLKLRLNEEMILSLDKDGDGVDKLEFVLGMLEKLELISEEDYAPFLRQFEEFDVTKDGRLNHDDLAAIVFGSHTLCGMCPGATKAHVCGPSRTFAVGQQTLILGRKNSGFCTEFLRGI